jgi:WD40 repeat protein
LKLWKVNTGKCLRTFGEHKYGISSVCLSRNGCFVISGGNEDTLVGPGTETLKLWEVLTGKCLYIFEEYNEVSSLCLSKDEYHVLFSKGCNILLWKIKTGRCLRTFEGHTGFVASVCLSGDGRFALSGSYDKTLKLWDVEIGKCLRTFEGHTDKVTSLCLSQDGRFALSGDSDGTIKLWFLDWDLELKQPADWDEGARPYLDIFIQQQTPYAATLPTDREPTEEEITLALTRRGTPTWTEADFNNLFYTLGCAGYGWLRPEGIKKQLDKVSSPKIHTYVSKFSVCTSYSQHCSR